MISLFHNSTTKTPQLSCTSALLSQLASLMPKMSSDQNDAVSNKRKMWSEANRRKTFINWPHMDYRWAIPDTMAQAGFYHQVKLYSFFCYIINVAIIDVLFYIQADRRTYPNSVDRAVCFTCNVGLVCWEPTDEPWYI